MRRRILFGVAAVLFLPIPVDAQSTPLRLKQDRDGTPAQALSAAEFATLGDPFFKLMLKDKANTVSLRDIEQAIQPDASKRRLFVVSERIVSPAQTESRRAVLAFAASHNGEQLQGNVMLSFSFGRNGPSDGIDIEALGWDNHRGRYNYYKLDRTGTADPQLTWKFRNSSDRADLLRPVERDASCLRCHVNGAPIMKELFLPWNNWHSGSRFRAEYLVDGSGHSNPWPAAATPRFKTSLDTAERLEVDFMIPAVKRFNVSRLNAALKRRDDTGDRLVDVSGRMTVVEAPRLLRSLFETTEVNLTASRDKSGVHPFAPASEFVPTIQIRVPDNFFLNTHLIAGGGTPEYKGLKLSTAAQFRDFAKLTQEENKSLFDKFNVLLNDVRGDTNFAWFVPEPSLVDNDLVDQLLRTGVITPHFLAAVLAIDLETPIFSERRSQLMKYVPDQIEFRPVPNGVDPNSLPRDADDDLLTQAVVAAIDQDNPVPGSPAGEFRTLLRLPDARQELSNRVEQYVERAKQRLSGPQRQQELERLFRITLDRRLTMLRHPVLRNLDETGGRILLPLPGSSFGVN